MVDHLMRAGLIGIVVATSAGCMTLAPCSASADGLECRASRGVHTDQLALAKMIEEADPARAAKLYASAARFSSGTTFIFVPGIKGQSGYVMPVRSGADQPGLAEAKFRLAMMYQLGRGVTASPQRATSLLKEAAEQGFEPARAAINQGLP